MAELKSPSSSVKSLGAAVFLKKDPFGSLLCPPVYFSSTSAGKVQSAKALQSDRNQTPAQPTAHPHTHHDEGNGPDLFNAEGLQVPRL
eukprot:902789-Prorocentrum_minimum.AAC.3